MKDDLSGRSPSDTVGAPQCFGDGEKVCPVDEEGIMQPRRECVPCPYLRPCLQRVMVGRGKLEIAEQPASRVTGFLKRWSERKLKK
ncbi:MAG: hypothetical protein P4L43_06470 [Syntrophobacteraceae bacterium]|nr:hypothetical protein [Syntrophobacteraceae bacterium]